LLVHPNPLATGKSSPTAVRAEPADRITTRTPTVRLISVRLSRLLGSLGFIATRTLSYLAIGCLFAAVEE